MKRPNFLRTRVNAIFITKIGKIIKKSLPITSEGTVEWNDGSYNIEKNRRLLWGLFNRPTYVYMEGVSDALNFNEISTTGKIKIGAKAQKQILTAKLFDDLLKTDEQKYMFIVFGMLGIIIIMLLIIMSQVSGGGSVSGSMTSSMGL